MVQETDIDEGEPGQHSSNEQQAGRDEFSRARADRGRFGRAMGMIVMVHRLVMGDMNARRLLAYMRSRVGSLGVSMCFRMMFDGVAARIAPMRPDDGDDAREDGAQQRQENDGLDHSRVSPSSDSRLQPRSNRGCGNRPPGWRARSRLRRQPPSAPAMRTPGRRYRRGRSKTPPG